MGEVVVGIDASLTGTGLVALAQSGEMIDNQVVKPKNVRGVERLIYVENQVAGFLRTYHPTLICLEGYAFAANSQAAYQIGELGGVIRRRIRILKETDDLYNLQIVAPAQLKKFVTGKGNTQKNVVLLSIYRRWNIEFGDDNLGDAYCLARIALALRGMDNKLNKPQAEVIEALRAAGAEEVQQIPVRVTFEQAEKLMQQAPKPGRGEDA